MDSFEINKIAGAILGTALLVMGLRIVSEGIYGVEPLEKSAYDVPGVAATPSETAGAEPAEAGPSFDEALASADVAKGKSVAAKCQTCHSLEKNGPNKIGPDLWDVVGRPVATHGGFNYSDALKKVGGNWDFDKIEKFLTSPRSFAPGTKMSFPGLPSVKDRANLLAYLNTQSDNPLPLPAAAAPAEKAAPASPAAEQKPGEEAPAPAEQPAASPEEPQGEPHPAQ